MYAVETEGLLLTLLIAATYNYYILPRAYRAAEGGERACNSANGIIQIDSIFRNHVLHCLFHIRGARSSGTLTALVTATVPENIHSLVSQ